MTHTVTTWSPTNDRYSFVCSCGAQGAGHHTTTGIAVLAGLTHVAMCTRFDIPAVIFDHSIVPLVLSVSVTDEEQDAA